MQEGESTTGKMSAQPNGLHNFCSGEPRGDCDLQACADIENSTEQRVGSTRAELEHETAIESRTHRDCETLTQVCDKLREEWCEAS